jgi:hypothetical protein
MNKCYFCKNQLKDLPYKCKFCGMKFCKEHRLPENHNCPFDLKDIKSIENENSKKTLIYQDALDFMNNGLTVAKIYDYATSHKLGNKDAIDLLIYFLENSEDTEIIKNSIIAFKLLNLKSNKDLKQIATEIITQIFPKKSKNLLDWIRKHNT